MKLVRWMAPAALAVAVVVAFVVAPASAPGQDSQTFAVPPAAVTAACPGPQRLPVGDQGSAGELSADTDDRLLLAFGEGTSYPVGLGTAWPFPIAGSVERVGDGDLEGFAAVTCLPPGFDEWLVGGATTIGSSARLVLSNPADAPAEARVTVYGPLGEVAEPLVIAVPPRGQEERLIEGVAAELATLALHIESSGPGLVATLQDSRLEGFQPAGTEWVAGVVPLERQVIPALGSVVEESTVTLRLMAPEGATATVSLSTEDGVDPWSGARNLSLDPGVVTDIEVPLEGVGALEITSDAPVLAAARTVVPRIAAEGTAGDLAFDHAWTMGIDESAEASLTAVVPLELATIAVYAPVGGTVTFTDAEGATVATATVPARTVVRLPITVAPGTLVSARGRFAWAIEIANDDGYLTTLMPVDTTRTDLEVVVMPGAYAPVVSQ